MVTYDLRWFFADKRNFVSLSILLKKRKNKFYESKLVRLLLKEYWQKTQKRILYRQFIPQLAFIIITVVFFHYDMISLQNTYPSKSEEDEVRLKILGSITALLLPWMIRIEVVQFIAEGKSIKKYLFNAWNLVDLVKLSLTSFLTINSLIGWFVERSWFDMKFVQALRILAAFDSFLLVLKIFDWMRLFDNTAFYMSLLAATLREI